MQTLRAIRVFFVAYFSEAGVLADVYMNAPRGSNNKMTEQSNNRQNGNRLFDSQNNGNAGYQIGDKCVPHCKTGNTYDATKAGSQEGQMYYYHNSELLIEWTAQHGCGTPAQNTECQIILQYMCGSWATSGRAGEQPLRDGKDPDSGSRRRSGGGDDANAKGANLAAADDLGRGRHETFEYYNNCRKRRRNKGLYNAARNLNKKIGATATRQNNGGTRRGLECPEERDYYPYWHPSEWQDIVVLTSEPEKRCDFYRQESQNVQKKGYCSHPKLALDYNEATLEEDDQVPNTPEACADDGGSWIEVDSWDIDPPECKALPLNRDNHHGNIQTGKSQGYTWKIPDHIPDGDTCVLRLRYNMTSGDFYKNPDDEEDEEFDYFFELDSKYNTEDRRPLGNNPKKDFIGLGWHVSGPLQTQVNTAQFGRTFQDCSHTFKVRKRPDGVADDVRIVNYNVRGRRGNIQQVYPAVEYDFIPQDTVVAQGDFLHFQWTGSDANANGNAGNGKTGTDRSNLVQIASRATTNPLPIEKHTLFFDGANLPEFDDAGGNIEHTCSGNLFASCGRSTNDAQAIIARFAFLDQQAHAKAAGTTCPETEEEAKELKDDDDNNCLQLNAAPAYFDGGLVEMTVMGEHHIASTRNNDYSNRSQKATITVTRRRVNWWEVVLVVGVPLLVAYVGYQAAIAAYAFHNPTSSLFSRQNRPMLLKMPILRGAVQKKEQERREYKKALQDAWKDHCTSSPDTVAIANGASKKGDIATAAANADLALPPESFDIRKKDWRCLWCCPCLRNHRNKATYCCDWFRTENIFIVVFVVANLTVGLIGFLRNYKGGFNYWFAMAKTGGYLLDFNLSVILIPTLRSMQTGARDVRALDGLFNDDPILFHIQVAGCVLASATIHVVGHIVHMQAILSSYPYEPPVTEKQRMSGMNGWEIFFNIDNRFAGFTGVLITVLMMPMFMTGLSFVRRYTFNFHQCPKTFRDMRSWSLLFGAFFFMFPLWLPRLLWRLVFRRTCGGWIPESGKLGGFQIFWEVHRSWKPIFVLLLLHGPNCWIWFMWPLILVVCDRLVRWERRKVSVYLKSAELLKGKVVKLTFAPPPGFVYQAGMYAMLNCDNLNGEEWHPFTLTSAPEESFLSCHIRSPDDLDWCSALRRKLVEEPAIRISNGAADKLLKNSRVKVIYDAYIPDVFTADAGAQNQDDALSRPFRVEIYDDEGNVKNKFETSLDKKKHEDKIALCEGKEPGKWAAKDEEDDDFIVQTTKDAAKEEREKLRKHASEISLIDILQPRRPADVVQMSIDGPHGAPSELVWRHRVVVLVGAGIGVTPFASILRSITLRTPSKAEQANVRGLTKHKRKAKSDTPTDTATDEAEWRPCDKVHFYWLCRSQEEFEWFYGLLAEAVKQGSQDRIEVNLFRTGETELSKVKSLGCGFREFFGRPNWNRIFPSIAELYPQANVGVFLCGPRVLRGDLAAGCKKANDTNAHGARFNLHAENF